MIGRSTDDVVDVVHPKFLHELAMAVNSNQSTAKHFAIFPPTSCSCILHSQIPSTLFYSASSPSLSLSLSAIAPLPPKMTASIDLSTPLQSPNPNPSSIPNPNHSPQANVYRIGGVPVEFPYKPYGSQLAFMGRVISTLSRARHQGHSHALLESPTGTGKTLSLLCSALAWQQDQLRRPPPLAPSPQPPPATGPTPDPLLHGGGFVPEPEPSSELSHSKILF